MVGEVDGYEYGGVTEAYLGCEGAGEPCSAGAQSNFARGCDGLAGRAAHSPIGLEMSGGEGGVRTLGFLSEATRVGRPQASDSARVGCEGATHHPLARAGGMAQVVGQ